MCVVGNKFPLLCWCPLHCRSYLITSHFYLLAHTSVQDLITRLIDQLTSFNAVCISFHSGKEFDGNSVGLAIPDSICTDRAVAAISVKLLINRQHQLANVIAHMIGHNIGLERDAPSEYIESNKYNVL